MTGTQSTDIALVGNDFITAGAIFNVVADGENAANPIREPDNFMLAE